ncbi:hypothetical protein C4D60_Mb06t05410 [Musa balbisiana]|uniref:Secreted protein n=1 Tax=Musa balbisiana TaxID=52838 RepID=A0A4S8IN90_MUSBA|nr:hypothetical protein C4D60_Mb06t05410 [Musa balbisiana]
MLLLLHLRDLICLLRAFVASFFLTNATLKTDPEGHDTGLVRKNILLGKSFSRGSYVLKVLVGTCNRKISISFTTIVVLYSTCPLLEEKEFSPQK